MKSPCELVEVEPGAERALAAADHHDANVVVVLGPLPRPIELVQQLLADRVAFMRAVEPDPRDVPVDLVLDRLGFE